MKRFNGIRVLVKLTHSWNKSMLLLKNEKCRKTIYNSDKKMKFSMKDFYQ